MADNRFGQTWKIEPTFSLILASFEANLDVCELTVWLSSNWADFRTRVAE